jgi:hypothetical protein
MVVWASYEEASVGGRTSGQQPNRVDTSIGKSVGCNLDVISEVF